MRKIGSMVATAAAVMTVIIGGQFVLRAPRQAAATPAIGSIPTLTGDIPVVGDWDGNGTDTIGVYRNGTWFLRNSNAAGAPDLAFTWGSPGDIPVVGDWDGNGTDTISVFRNGTWFLRNHNSAGPVEAAFGYGQAGDVPIAGDWDGNGTDTIGIFRDGIWYLRNHNFAGAPAAAVSWGAADDIPVVGDWDGNGSTTLGVRRDNQFFFRNSISPGPADGSSSFGNAGDVALAGSFDGGSQAHGGVRQGSTFQLPTSRGIQSVDYGLPSSSGVSAGERRVVELTNAQRAAAGCGAVTIDIRLVNAARAHSADMASRSYFSHSSLDGRTVSDRVRGAGYSGGYIGENIAAGYASPEAVVDGWMNSAGHRANILNCNYRHIGVGFASGGPYGSYWTQDFASPA